MSRRYGDFHAKYHGHNIYWHLIKMEYRVALLAEARTWYILFEQYSMMSSLNMRTVLWSAIIMPNHKKAQQSANREPNSLFVLYISGIICIVRVFSCSLDSDSYYPRMAPTLLHNHRANKLSVTRSVNNTEQCGWIHHVYLLRHIL